MIKYTRLIDVLGEEATRKLSVDVMEQYNMFVSKFHFVPADSAYWGGENDYETLAAEALLQYMGIYEPRTLWGKGWNRFLEAIYSNKKMVPEGATSEECIEGMKKLFGNRVYLDLNEFPPEPFDPEVDMDPKGWDDPERIFNVISRHPADKEEWEKAIEDFMCSTGFQKRRPSASQRKH